MTTWEFQMSDRLQSLQLTDWKGVNTNKIIDVTKYCTFVAYLYFFLGGKHNCLNATSRYK